eukprot:Nitzschia sp. Nitz4//scaffold6_size259037//176906//177049//NITZ4_001096-RA/size259037-exonerate_protein2genome-gene-0.208-mRNA-1//-1//CDS//3329556959//4683//frame0
MMSSVEGVVSLTSTREICISVVSFLQTKLHTMSAPKTVTSSCWHYLL